MNLDNARVLFQIRKTVNQIARKRKCADYMSRLSSNFDYLVIPECKFSENVPWAMIDKI